jgi:thiol-disulfide isomerase/thioredoxin
LLSMVDRLSPKRAKTLLEEVIASAASDGVRQQAQRVLNRPATLGKPLAMKFEAIDGRDVDVRTLKGKVVLIDFWSTWHGPCLGEIPKLKAVYDSFHDQGFEIVGICLDWDKAALRKFVQEKELPWPQFCDGKGWNNRLGETCAIGGIPTMWLVGKDGNVADLNGREDLAAKVKKLLAGP